jgi:hypothetical protein
MSPLPTTTSHVRARHHIGARHNINGIVESGTRANLVTKTANIKPVLLSSFAARGIMALVENKDSSQKTNSILLRNKEY